MKLNMEHQHTHHHNTKHNAKGHETHEDHSHGHESHEHHNHSDHLTDYWQRFIVCTIVTLPVLLLSPMLQQWFNFEIKFTGDKYVLAILSTFIFFYGGYPFLKGLYDELKARAIGMMTLI